MKNANTSDLASQPADSQNIQITVSVPNAINNIIAESWKTNLYIHMYIYTYVSAELPKMQNNENIRQQKSKIDRNLHKQFQQMQSALKAARPKRWLTHTHTKVFVYLFSAYVMVLNEKYQVDNNKINKISAANICIWPN